MVCGRWGVWESVVWGDTIAAKLVNEFPNDLHDTGICGMAAFDADGNIRRSRGRRSSGEGHFIVNVGFRRKNVAEILIDGVQ